MLFVLNVVIFGRLERELDEDDMFFLPHSAKEQANILWRDGAAVGFYTTKMKGEGHRAVRGQGHHRVRPWGGSQDSPSAIPSEREPSSTRNITDSAALQINPRRGFRLHHGSRLTGTQGEKRVPLTARPCHVPCKVICCT